MRAAIYLRVSSDEQAEHGLSLTTQRKSCENYAHNAGIRVSAVFEEDFSGRFLDRPELTQLRTLVRDGEIDTVIVHAIDRYTREPAHIDLLLDELVNTQIELHTPQGKQDIESPEGRMFLGIQAQFGRYWWQKIRESSMRTRNHIKDKGGFYGNGAPYGYQVVGEKLNYRLEEKPDEAAIVREIFEAIADGVGSQTIANQLTARGVPPPRKDIWYPAGIVHMVRKTAYMGLYAYQYKMVNGKRIKLPKEEWKYYACPQIVTPELWNQANIRLSTSGTRFVRKHFYVMAGRLTCQCGYAVTAYPIPDRKSFGNYGCNGRKVVKNGCAMPYLAIRDVDNAFWKWITELLQNPESKLTALAEAQRQQERELAPLETQLANLIEAQQKLQRRLRKYEEMCADGDISKNVFRAHKEEIETQLMVLARDTETLESKLDAIRMPQNQRERLLALFAELDIRPHILNDLSIEEKHAIVEELDLSGRLTLEDGKPVLYITWYGYEERCNFQRRSWK